MRKKISLLQKALFEKPVSSSCWQVGIIALKVPGVDWATAWAGLLQQLPYADRCSEFMPLGRFFFYLELELDEPPTDEWVEEMERLLIQQEFFTYECGEIDRPGGYLREEIEHPPLHGEGVPQVLIDMFERALVAGRK